MIFAFAITIPLPFWLVALIVCVIGEAISQHLIGPPRNSGDYGIDVLTPLLQLLSLVFWIVVYLVSIIAYLLFTQ